MPRDSTMFTDRTKLDPNQPSELLIRDRERQQIRDSLAPLEDDDPATNLAITGPPGQGKTTCVTTVLDQLNIHTAHVKCMHHQKTTAILREIVDNLYKFEPDNNRPARVYLGRIRKLLERKGSLAVCLDDADYAEDLDEVLGMLTEAAEGTDASIGIILTTNHEAASLDLSERVWSRLSPSVIEFTPYTVDELTDILRSRAEMAFEYGAVSESVLQEVAEQTVEAEKGVRYALTLLKGAGEAAEREKASSIQQGHLKTAVKPVRVLAA